MGWGASTFCTPLLTPTPPPPASSSKHQTYIRHITPLVVYTAKTTCHIRHQKLDFIHNLLYTTHRLGPLAAKISAAPVIDVSARPCAAEDCPLGQFVHQEEVQAATPSKFLVIAT